MAGPEPKSTKYEPAVELSRGALGILHAGRGPGRLVLLRHIEEKPPWDAASLDLLTESVEKARGIHNPRLLAVVDAVREPGSLLIATEYVEGVALQTLMTRGRKHKQRMPVTAAIRVGIELARAVDAAEELLRARGDTRLIAGLHPECVMISSGDDALIGDLGITVVPRVPDHPDLAAYRAPEVDAHEPVVRQSAAVYSIGILLWELLSGQDAFGQSASGASAAAVRRLAREGKVPRLDSVVKDVPSLLVEMVMQAVRRDPSQRFPNLQTFGDSLAAAGKSAKPGELVRYVQKLCVDLIARQKSALVLRNVTVASWRPTVHTMEKEPEIPKAPRLAGVPALETPLFTMPADQASDAPQAESVEKSDAPVKTVRVDMPVPTLAGGEPPAPLLLVNKPTPVAPTLSTAPSVRPVRPVLDSDDIQIPVRRRGFPIFIFFLLIGGAVAGAFYAMKNGWIGGSRSSDLAVIPPSDSAALAASSSAGSRSSPPASGVPTGSSRTDDRSGRPRDGREPSRDRAPREPAAPPGSGRPSDNPYMDEPKPKAPAPSATQDYGF